MKADTFRLGCTPVVNLFEQIAEPIALTQRKHEYRITPDVAFPLGMEVYSVDDVTSTDPTTATTKSFNMNDGTISVQAVASAQANGGDATASAYNTSAVGVEAFGYNGGDASAYISGAGSIDVGLPGSTSYRQIGRSA